MRAAGSWRLLTLRLPFCAGKNFSIENRNLETLWNMSATGDVRASLFKDSFCFSKQSIWLVSIIFVVYYWPAICYYWAIINLFDTE
jgi:hypothetical protein